MKEPTNKRFVIIAQNIDQAARTLMERREANEGEIVKGVEAWTRRIEVVQSVRKVVLVKALENLKKDFDEKLERI